MQQKKESGEFFFFSSYSSFRLSHFAASACIRKKKHIYSYYTTVYKEDNLVMKEKEKYISYIADGIYQAFFFVLSGIFAIPIS